MKFKISYLIIIIFILAVNICSQTIDDLSKTVVFLLKETQAFEMKSGQKFEVWYKDPSTNKFEPKITKQSGTGFILKNNGKDYLVTAKHVASFLQDTSKIIVNVQSNQSIKITFDFINNLKGARWFYHPIADIAIHPIAYPIKKVMHIAINAKDILKEEKSVQLLSDVYILGFPLGLGIHESISPISKKAQVASNITTLEHPNFNPELKYYLLDQALAQGYSGAPIFCVEELPTGLKIAGQNFTQKKIVLMGILSGALSDATGGKFSLVVPIFYLWDILKSEQFIKYESQFLSDINK